MFILNNSLIMSLSSCYCLGCIIIMTGVFLTPQHTSLARKVNDSITSFIFSLVPISVPTRDIYIRFFIAVK